MDIKKKTIIFTIIGCILLITFLYLKKSHDNIETNSENSEKVIIKWMVFGEKYKDSDSVFLEFNKKLQTHFPGTTVEFEVVQKENYKKNWDMKIATNETLDLAWVGKDIFNYTEEVKKGSFMALGYLIETYGHNLVEQIPKEMWELQKNEGNTYSIPIPGILYRKSYAIVANKELIEKYGDIKKIGSYNRSKQYTDEECYNSFEEFLANTKKGGEIGTGISYQTFSQMADKGSEGIYGSGSPFVIGIFDKKLAVYNKYEKDSWKIYFKTMADWYKKGYIREDIIDILNPLSNDGKINGTVMFVDDFGEHNAVVSVVPTEYETVVEPLESYKYISYGACRNSIVIPKSANNPQRALEIINFLISDKGMQLYRLLANGIEGVHYTTEEHHVIKRNLDGNGNPLYRLPQYTIGDVFQNYKISKSEFNQIDMYNRDAIVSPLSGFELDTRMIILEMSKVDLIVDEYKERLCMGTEEDWEEVYNEFISKIKKAGSDKVIQEMQKQIDKFIENKSKN